MINFHEIFFFLQTSPTPAPIGPFGDFACKIAERVAVILPSTPSSLTLPALTNQAGTSLTFVGSTLLYRISVDMLQVLTLIIPFKMIQFFPRF